MMQQKKECTGKKKASGRKRTCDLNCACTCGSQAATGYGRRLGCEGRLAALLALWLLLTCHGKILILAR